MMLTWHGAGAAVRALMLHALLLVQEVLLNAHLLTGSADAHWKRVISEQGG